jgi:hypothetical protein
MDPFVETPESETWGTRREICGADYWDGKC